MAAFFYGWTSSAGGLQDAKKWRRLRSLPYFAILHPVVAGAPVVAPAPVVAGVPVPQDARPSTKGIKTNKAVPFLQPYISFPPLNCYSAVKFVIN